MSNNHLNISFVWKLLVAIAVCLWLKFEHSLVASDKHVCSVITYSEVRIVETVSK